MKLTSWGVFYPAELQGGRLGQFLTLKTLSRLNYKLPRQENTQNTLSIFQMEALLGVRKVFSERMAYEVFG